MTKLEAMLKYVSEHNDFYKKRIAEYGIRNPLDITQWPILTRKELQENRYNMFSDGYKAKYFSQQLRRHSSSGTSGTPINVYWDPNDYLVSSMELCRLRNLFHEIKPQDRYIKFCLNLGNFSSNLENFYVQYPSSVLNIDISKVIYCNKFFEMIELIDDFKPKWLYIQPSILEKLVLFYTQNNVNPPNSLTYIESVGEVLPVLLRKSAEQLFNVPIVNMYGSEEMNGIAYEYDCEGLHVLSDNVWVECCNNETIRQSAEGEAIITNLNNHAMPLIRYNQADIIEFNNTNLCQSKLNQPVIKQIIGRSCESVMINDFELNSIILVDIISTINNQYSHIILNYSFKFSKSKKILYINIYLAKEKLKWANSLKKDILNDFCKIIGVPSNITIVANVEENINNYYGKHILNIIE